jgi:hypothetical protein
MPVENSVIKLNSSMDPVWKITDPEEQFKIIVSEYGMNLRNSEETAWQNKHNNDSQDISFFGKGRMCNTNSNIVIYCCHLLVLPYTFVSVGTTSLKLTNAALLRITEQVILETLQVTILLILSYWKCHVLFAIACHIVYKQYEPLYSPVRQ